MGVVVIHFPSFQFFLFRLQHLMNLSPKTFTLLLELNFSWVKKFISVPFANVGTDVKINNPEIATCHQISLLLTLFCNLPFSCRDEGVHWGIQNGLQLSRSTIIYFKHNNMESLRNTLEKVTQENKQARKLRRYIVVEAVYQVSTVYVNVTYWYEQVTLISFVSRHSGSWNKSC